MYSDLIGLMIPHTLVEHEIHLVFDFCPSVSEYICNVAKPDRK